MRSEGESCGGPAAGAGVEKLVYNTEEACRALGVGRVTIWRLVRRGMLVPVSYSRHKLYPVAAIRRLVAGK
jgi:hypothetical protein